MTAADFAALPVGVPVTGDLHTTNFFNGRLLTARDLRREQETARALHDRLGLAVGDGVVRGFRVGRPGGPDALHPVVDVTAGLAVNRRGATVELADDVRVTLAGSAVTPSAPGPATAFAACSGLPDGASLTVEGIYLLTVTPAGTPVGRAQIGGLGTGARGCDTDARADGVAFRVVRIGLEDAALADRNRLRNRLAHLMFGTDDPRRARRVTDPFGAPGGDYGLLADLRAVALSDDEVPLACILWTPGTGIGFVDEWCVRREIAGRAEARARHHQFRAELADLAGGSAGAPQTVRAADVFVRLPPAGLVPLASAAAPAGFDQTRFLDGLVTRPAAGRDPFMVDGARLAGLLEAALDGEPVDPAGGELVWVYLVRQNATGSPPARPYLVFASGHLPPIAEARLDLSRCDLANYAIDGSHGKELA